MIWIDKEPIFCDCGDEIRYLLYEDNIFWYSCGTCPIQPLDVIDSIKVERMLEKENYDE